METSSGYFIWMDKAQFVLFMLNLTHLLKCNIQRTNDYCYATDIIFTVILWPS